MTPLFKTLSLRDRTPIVVRDTPSGFEPESGGPSGVEVVRALEVAENAVFALAFVLDRQRLEDVAPDLTVRAQGDAVVEFAYLRLTSKPYESGFNRCEGWASLAQEGLGPAPQVAVDEDRSAVRFRRIEYVRPSSRGA